MQLFIGYLVPRDIKLCFHWRNWFLKYLETCVAISSLCHLLWKHRSLGGSQWTKGQLFPLPSSSCVCGLQCIWVHGACLLRAATDSPEEGAEQHRAQKSSPERRHGTTLCLDGRAQDSSWEWRAWQTHVAVFKSPHKLGYYLSFPIKQFNCITFHYFYHFIKFGFWETRKDQILHY